MYKYKGTYVQKINERGVSKTVQSTHRTNI